jgi:N-succinyldiaminopimelate aminotransferase
MPVTADPAPRHYRGSTMTIAGPWERAARGAMLLGADATLRPTVFAEMSALALSTDSINLGQGFPDEDGPAEVLEAARTAISSGLNQYPPGPGMPVLREAIAEHHERFYGVRVNPASEVLVTAGATEAIAASLLAFVSPGDEVLTIEPFYDSYGAIIGLAGGVHRTVPVAPPSFLPTHEALRAAVTERTRVILLNSPHNPTGAMLPRETLEFVAQLAAEVGAIVVADEVYEHLTFGTQHVTLASIPAARGRSITIGSGGKTFNTTGWKIGWLIADAEIVQAVQAVKQFLTFVNGGPFQPAIATGLRLPGSFFTGVASTLQSKRDLLAAGLRAAGFEVHLPQAGYFIVADAAALGVADATAFARELPARVGVVGIPVTALVGEEHRAQYSSLLRFAFCKRVDVLETAAERLAGLSL